MILAILDNLLFSAY